MRLMTPQRRVRLWVVQAIVCHNQPLSRHQHTGLVIRGLELLQQRSPRESRDYIFDRVELISRRYGEAWGSRVAPPALAAGVAPLRETALAGRTTGADGAGGA